MILGPKGILSYEALKDKIFKRVIKGVTLLTPNLKGQLTGA